jgi:hypothetical protein
MPYISYQPGEQTEKNAGNQALSAKTHPGQIQVPGPGMPAAVRAETSTLEGWAAQENESDRNRHA